MSTKVLLSKQFHTTDIDYLADRIDASVQLVEPASYDEQSIIESMPGIDVMLGGILTEKIAQAAENVAFFQIPWTGVDALQMHLLKNYQLTVCNSHSNSLVVAEHAVGMWLALAKKLAVHDRMLRNGDWNRVRPDGNDVSPFSAPISGSRCLLVGCGAIGQSIAQFMSGFNCEISSVTLTGNRRHAALRHCYKLDQLDQALAEADVVFVTVPLTEATTTLFGGAQFGAMKNTAIFVNLARGAVVEEEALYGALFEQTIAGAAIDTWYQYPSKSQPVVLPSENFAFQKLDNLLLSPHRAGYINSGFPHLDDAIENLNRYVQGQPLLNCVDAVKGY